MGMYSVLFLLLLIKLLLFESLSSDLLCLYLPGFLISLLTQLTDHYTRNLCHDADTQTSLSSYGESLGMN